MTNLLSVGTVSSRYSATQVAMRRQEAKKKVRYDFGPESKRKEGCPQWSHSERAYDNPVWSKTGPVDLSRGSRGDDDFGRR